MGLDRTLARCAAMAGLVSALLVLASSCRSKPRPAPAPPVESATASEAEGPGESAAEPEPEPPAAPEGEPGEATPLYPHTGEPPDPIAERYCDLVYEVSERKRRECCPSTPASGPRPTQECVRALSYALGSLAVFIERSELDACEAAILEEAKYCDWGGSLPPACEGIIRGQLDTMLVCRSSLECKAGLHCAGLSANTPGKCASAQPEGMPCAGPADWFAAFVRQDPELRNSKCAGYCARRHCAALVPAGEECRSSRECGRGRHCIGGKCSSAPLPVAGDPCRQKQCGAGLACVSGVCVALRRVEEACESDGDCRSAHCERPDGGPGRCADICRIRRPMTVQISGQ